MKRPAAIAALVALALIGLLGIASAEPKSFWIDPAHSEAGFNIRHFFSRVHGAFTDFKGTVVFDPKNLAASSVEVTIRDTSIFTGNDRRDGHLRTQDFFWTEKYPTITFKSNKVTPGADSAHFQVLGDLTIRDVTKPVTLDAQLLGMGPVPGRGGEMSNLAGFSAKTSISRKDFGIVWNRTLDQGGVMLGDDVEIVLGVEGRNPPPQMPPPGAAAADKGKTNK